MYCSWKRTRLALLFTLAAVEAMWLTGCSRKPPTELGDLQRIAIPAFENLSSDISLDWVGQAVSGVIGTQLSGLPTVIPIEPQSLRDVDTGRLNKLVQGYYTIAGDQLRLTAQVRDPAALKNIKVISAAGSRSVGVLPLIDSLAHQIDPAAHPYSTKDETAVQQYFQAVSAASPDRMIADLELAAKADPSFGPAYLARIQMLLARGNTDGARQAIAEAAQHSKNFSPVDRAKFDVLRARLDGTQQQSAASVSRLAALLPTDISVWQMLASLRTASNDFAQASQAYQSALKVDPGSIPLLNLLAYTQAFAGDVNGALNTVDRYRKLAPDDANAFDTAAEIDFFAGRFAEAEHNFVEANRRNNTLLNGAELYRAAVAAFLAGNIKAANDYFNVYTGFLKAGRDPLISVRQAIWAYQTGDRSAVSELQNYANRKDTPAGSASIAHAQLAIWFMDSGQTDRAREEAARALAMASNPADKNFAGLTSFLVAPNIKASEWKLRAERAAAGQAMLQRQLLGYALLLQKEYADAVPVWKAIYDASGLEAMGEPKVLLAYAYLQAGLKREAADLMKTGVLPPKSIDPGVSSLQLSKYVFVRSRLK